jgi:alanine dehydrogenase
VDIGVLGTSRKANERRVPIHPAHLAALPEGVRRRLVFEHGYGAAFGTDDAALAARAGGVASRAELLAEAHAVVLLKPDPADLLAMRPGAALWGWPHCVQQRAVVQAAIDRRLTLVAFEAMFEGGRGGRHTFARNNELAGYAAVLHAFQVRGLDAYFGPPCRAVVLGLGAVGRGAVRGLRAMGVGEIVACVPEGEPLDAPGLRVVRVRRSAADPARMEVADTGAPLLETLLGADVIVNAVLQDPARPVMFADAPDLGRFAPGTLLLDVSCDEGMGFAGARPTGFDAPFRDLGPCLYYGVDHTPTHLWASASWAISEALGPHLATLAAGPAAWAACPTVGPAIAVEAGVVRDPAILAFQGRDAGYPHAITV